MITVLLASTTLVFGLTSVPSSLTPSQLISRRPVACAAPVFLIPPIASRKAFSAVVAPAPVPLNTVAADHAEAAERLVEVISAPINKCVERMMSLLENES